MSNKDSAQNVIESYRKRQSMAQKAPIVFGLAAVLLIVGAGALIYWLTSSDKPSIGLFATDTPTATLTSTATQTQVPTNTPTVTPTSEPTTTSTATTTATAAGPFVYKVQEGDYLALIASKYGVDLMTLYAMNPNIDPANPVIRVGQEIIIPGPNTTLPTATPVPSTSKEAFNYLVQKGDTLLGIAGKFNTTTDSIIKANPDKLKSDKDVIYEGMSLKIFPNIVTPVPTATVGTVYPTAPVLATSTPSPTP